MMKKLKQRGGFSLVELIVATAILAVLAGIMTGLLAAGLNFYRKHTARVSLQMESQIVMAQIREYVVDSTGLSQSPGLWEIRREWSDDDTEPTIYLKYEADTLKLKEGDDASAQFFPMADNVTAFEMDALANPVIVRLTLTKRGAEWKEEQVIARRNP